MQRSEVGAKSIQSEVPLQACGMTQQGMEENLVSSHELLTQAFKIGAWKSIQSFCAYPRYIHSLDKDTWCVEPPLKSFYLVKTKELLCED